MSELNSSAESTEAVAASTESTTTQPMEAASQNTEPSNAESSQAETNQPADDKAKPEEPATPDWFMKDKYRSVEEQAKAYKDLFSKVGKNWGPPKEDYSLEGIEGVAKDDPLLANLAPALKEMGLSQDGFSSLIKHYQQANVMMVKKFEEELKKELTENDVHTYNAVTNWMQQVFKPEEIEQIKNNWLMTPNDFKLFNTLRLMSGPSTNVPSPSDNGGPRFESSRSVENDKIKYRKEVKEKIRVPDKNYENELAQRYRDALMREQRAKG